jgi:hypothetical protein
MTFLPRVCAITSADTRACSTCGRRRPTLIAAHRQDAVEVHHRPDRTIQPFNLQQFPGRHAVLFPARLDHCVHRVFLLGREDMSRVLYHSDRTNVKPPTAAAFF